MPKTKVDRPRVTTYDPKPSGMSFAGGELRLFSKPRTFTIWPNGAPSRTMAPTGEVVTVNRDAKRVVFSDHRCTITDKKIANDMVQNGHFGEPDCYTVDVGCLPRRVAGLWPELSLNNQRRICLALIDGCDEDKALATVDEADVKKAQDARTSRYAAPTLLRCPVPGCVADAIEGPDALLELNKHINLVHPNWSGESAGANDVVVSKPQPA